MNNNVIIYSLVLIEIQLMVIFDKLDTYKFFKTEIKMKIKLGILFLYLIIAFPIKMTGQTENKHTIVTGNIKTNWSNQIQLGDSITSIAKDGTFRFEIISDKPKFFNLSYEYKNLELFITPNHSLYININGKDFYSSISIVEDEPKLNDFLLSQKRLMIKTNKYLNDEKKTIFTSETSDFLSRIDSIKQYYINDFNEFLIENTESIDDWFVKKNIADIRYYFDRRKLWYPVRYCRYAGKDAQIEPNYFNNIAIGAFKDPDMLRSEVYLQFVNTYLNIQSAGKYKTTDYLMYPLKTAGSSRYQAIIDLKAHQQITDYLLTKQLKSIIECGINNVGNQLTRFKEDCKNDSLKKEVVQLYEKQLERRKLPSEIRVFKKIDNVELEAHIFYPDGFKKSDERPLYIFFHGGSWNEGNPEWGYGICQKYASKGLVAISFEYRLINLHGVKIPECIDDAKSAVTWARKNARKLGIDSEKIVAEGFSAGGHLAACTAIIDDTGRDSNDDKSISCKPNALILKSTSYSVKGFTGMIGGNGKLFSPLYQVKRDLVPTLMFHGTDDYIAPYKEFQSFVEKMKNLENDFTYLSLEGAGHFFIFDSKYKEIVSKMTEEFLISHGFINK